MAREEVLTGIKQAEGRVSEQAARAREEAEGLLARAREEAWRLQEAGQAAAQKRFEELVSVSELELKREREKVLARGHEKAEGLRRGAREKRERAVAHLLERFEARVKG
ncbi:MAG: hypothetical protein HY558_00275 [Euryarchaeota archaeon]|nr:hypothetical protein [Euryarchaeota archaeon]